jgi:heme-degrading monooxygenase HmoA
MATRAETTAKAYVSARWHVRDGEAAEFAERWRELMGWTRENYDELVSAALLRSEDDPRRFVSVAAWEGAEPRREWKNSDGFMTRFTRCRALCDDFEGGDYDPAAAV